MSDIDAVLAAALEIERKWDKKSRLNLQNAVRTTLPRHRASACMRHRLGGADVRIGVTHSGMTRMGGLMRCDANHICPVCHHRKMAKDKAIIANIVRQHFGSGGFLIDGGLTVSHQKWEPLSAVLARLEAVWESLRSKPIWSKLTKELGIIGGVRRLEVTLGPNGWHPHYHVSFLCDLPVAQEIKGRTYTTAAADVFASITDYWAAAGEKAGIKVSLHAQAAVALVAAADAAKAIAYNTKNMGYCDKPNSLTPMDFLRIIDQCGHSDAIHAAKRRFMEYAEAIHGKHTLSLFGAARSLKKAVAEPVAPSEEVEPLGRIAPQAWSAVIDAGLREEVAQVQTREELAATIMRAASFSGYAATPSGWLTLAPENKTVIRIKSAPQPSGGVT